MTDLDQRFYRAARQLREMPIDVPPLEQLGIELPPSPPATQMSALPRPQRNGRAARVPALLAAALLAVGGFAAVAANPARTAGVSATASVEASAPPAPAVFAMPTAADRTRDPRIVAPMSAADEVALVRGACAAAPSASRAHTRRS